jgi:hypothetical protein
MKEQKCTNAIKKHNTNRIDTRSFHTAVIFDAKRISADSDLKKSFPGPIERERESSPGSALFREFNYIMSLVPVFLCLGDFQDSLKGPKHEIFGSGVFTQIRPVLVGDLGIKPKNPKFLMV